jgi:Icc-related predicted phosphoesterase
MSAPTNVLAANLTGPATVRVAAAADVHCGEHNREAVVSAFAAIDGSVDLILLAGDLTTHGEPEQAAVLSDSCSTLSTPVVAVLGNHDHHAGRRDELVSVLTDGGINVLDGGHATYSVGDCQVGIAGTKGFVGGFRGLALPDFGEPSLRGIYAETTAEVDTLARGLAEIALCPFRIALLHYAPIAETLHGEPLEIWTFLGSDRLAAPILEHRPDLVLHGHAHAGAFEGALEGVPVHNVSVPVMGRDFWVFELTSADRAPGAIH